MGGDVLEFISFIPRLGITFAFHVRYEKLCINAVKPKTPEIIIAIMVIIIIDFFENSIDKYRRCNIFPNNRYADQYHDDIHQSHHKYRAGVKEA